MSSRDLVRWSGLALIVSAVLFILFFVLHPGGGDPPTVSAALNSLYAAEHTLGIAALMLMLLGLVGLYARQMSQTGLFGLVSFLVAFVGTALLLGVIFFDGYFSPVIATNAPHMLDATGALNT